MDVFSVLPSLSNPIRTAPSIAFFSFLSFPFFPFFRKRGSGLREKKMSLLSEMRGREWMFFFSFSRSFIVRSLDPQPGMFPITCFAISIETEKYLHRMHSHTNPGKPKKERLGLET